MSDRGPSSLASTAVDAGGLPSEAFRRRTRPLKSLVFGCERTMELVGALVVRMAPTPTKLALSRDLWALASTASAIRDRLSRLREPSSALQSEPPNDAYVRFTNEVVARAPDEQINIVRNVLYRDLVAAVAALRGTIRPEDEPTGDMLDHAQLALARLSKVPSPRPAAVDGDLLRTFRRSGGVLGVPDDRCAVAAAPALGLIPARPARERLGERAASAGGSALGESLHDSIFRVELAAAEICAANIAHFVDMPPGLRALLARQAWDEARHFELLAAQMEEAGTAPGDHAVSFEVWDVCLQGESLAERLIIEQRLGEGRALDGAPKTYGEFRGQHPPLAEIFEYIQADEIIHVRVANEWLRELLGSSRAVEEREASLRRRLAAAGFPIRHRHPVNEVDRTLAGFSEEELRSLAAYRTAWLRQETAGGRS